ncbi:MAG: hypothetical protein ACYCV5_00535 [Acidimicrobiales bacterium]
MPRAIGSSRPPSRPSSASPALPGCGDLTGVSTAAVLTPLGILSPAVGCPARLLGSRPGACRTCPSGVPVAAARPTFRTCPPCEAMCGLAVETRGWEVVAVRGDRDDVVSGGYVCP